MASPVSVTCCAELCPLVFLLLIGIQNVSFVLPMVLNLIQIKSWVSLFLILYTLLSDCNLTINIQFRN